MFQPSSELNSREDPVLPGSFLADPVLNPWCDYPMDVQDYVPSQRTDGGQSGGESLHHCPRDDSDEKPSSENYSMDVQDYVPSQWADGGQSGGESLRRRPRDNSDEKPSSENYSMDVQDYVPSQWTDGRQSGGESLPHRPRDDSDEKSSSENETRCERDIDSGWIQSKVRVREIDHSSELREYLRQSEGARTEAVRQNQELAAMNTHLHEIYEEQRKALETIQRDVEQWTETGRTAMQDELKTQHEAIAEMKREMEAECRKLEEEKERIWVQKENEVATMWKQYERDLRNIQRSQSNPPDIAWDKDAPQTQNRESPPSAQSTPTPHKKPLRRRAKVSKRVTVLAELMDDADTESNVDAEEPEQQVKGDRKTWGSPEEYMKTMEAMMNRLLDERGFVKVETSSTPRKQRASGHKARNLEEDKNDPNRSGHLEYVRSLFKEVYSVECDEDFGGYPSATMEEVKVFEEGGEGPENNYPLWDMRGTKTSLWNNAVIEVLTEKLLVDLEGRFPPKTREYWKNAIGEKFSRIKAVWNKTRPRMTETGGIEDPDKVEQRRIKDTERRLKRIRVRERRVNKYNRRLKIAKSLADAKQEAGEKDAVTWAWLTNVLERLGSDGMSSDESAADDIYTVYQTKVMPWRRNMETEWEIIDAQRFVDADIYTPRGSKPVKRMRGAGNALSGRRPVAKLPKVFYDEDWLERQPQRFQEQIPKEKFLWYNVLGWQYGRK